MLTGRPATEAKSQAAEPAGDGREPDWRAVLAARRLPVAVATVAVLAVTVQRLGLHASTLPVFGLGLGAAALASADLAILRLPNTLVGATALAVGAGCLLQFLAGHNAGALAQQAGCAVGVGGFYLLLYALSRGGLGMGDVKTAAVAGLALGTRGWRYALAATVLAYLITLGVIVVMLLRGHRRFPYGPGILAGALIVLLS